MFRRHGISETDRLRVLTTLAAGLRTGLPVPKVLECLEASLSPGASHLVRSTRLHVENGLCLSQAGALVPGLFAWPVPATLKVAEGVGTVPDTLERVARIRGSVQKRKTRLLMSLGYPLCLLAVGLPAVSLAVNTVLPQVAASLSAVGQALPAPTRILMEVVAAIGRHSVLIVGLMTATATAVWYKRQAVCQLMWMVPVVGPILTDAAWCDLASVLSLCLGTSMPLHEALRISSEASACQKVASAALEVSERLEAGVPLHLAAADLHPLLQGALVTGAETSCLSTTVVRVAGALESDVEIRLDAYTGLVQPVLTAIVAGFLGLMSVLICLPAIQPVIRQ